MATFRIFGGGQLIGSIGGTVYQRGRFGGVARNRSVPVNPATDRQERARIAMAYCSNEWKLLTPAQRNAWESYAEVTAWLNRLGDTSYLTGLMQFMRRATFQYNALTVLGQPISIDRDAPTAPGLPAIPTGTINADVNGGVVEIDDMNITPAAGETIEAKWVFNVSPLKNYYKGPFKLTSYHVGVMTPPWQWATTAPLMEGWQVIAKLRWLDSEGRLSQEAITRTTIVDTTP